MESGTAHKVAANTAGQIALRAVDVALGVVTLGIITRYLGTEGFGHYTTVTTILQLFIALIDFGLYATLLREISANDGTDTERITNNVFTLRLAGSVVCVLLAGALVAATPYTSEIKWGIFVASGAFLASSLITTLTALFQKGLQMVRIAAVITFHRVLLLVFTVAIVRVDGGIIAIFSSSTIAMGTAFLIVWYLLKKLPHPVRLRLRFDVAYIQILIKKTWPIALTIALNLIYFRADTIILSWFYEQSVVGIYGASYRVLEILASFPHMFMGLVMPILTAAWVERRLEALQSVWNRVFSFFLILTAPVIGVSLVLGNPIMELVAGRNFSAAGDTLKILVVASSAIFFSALYSYMVLVLDKQRSMIKYFLFTALLSLAGYFFFIPRYSYWGAAWVTLVSEICILVGAWYVIRKHVRLPIPGRTALKVTAATLCMVLSLIALQPLVPLIPLLLAGATVYFAAAVFFKAITVSDIRLLTKFS